MILTDFRRQKAFEWLAKWLLGGQVVCFTTPREQLRCHLGVKMGLREHVEPKMAKDGPETGPKRAHRSQWNVSTGTVLFRGLDSRMVRFDYFLQNNQFSRGKTNLRKTCLDVPP